MVCRFLRIHNIRGCEELYEVIGICFFFLVIARRFAHTDVRFPSFDDVRRKDTLDPHIPASETEDTRRALPSAIYYGGFFLFSAY